MKPVLSWKLALLISLYALPSYAYVDPGSGQFILQLVLGLLAGSLFYLKSIGAWIKGKLSGQKNASQPENNARSADEVHKSASGER